MGCRLAHGAALTLLLLAACSDDEPSAPSTFTPGEVINDTKPPPTVEEPPSGACSEEGEVQIVRTPAGLEACRTREAGAVVASTPNTWRCTCTTGTWRCELIDGGYGAGTCP